MRYFHNDSASMQFIGGTMVPPGEGRLVDELYLAPAEDAVDLLPPDDADADQAAADAALLANLTDLLAQPLRALLPTLRDASDETLADLARLEGLSETPRTTLLGNISELQLGRAQARAGAEPA